MNECELHSVLQSYCSILFFSCHADPEIAPSFSYRAWCCASTLPVDKHGAFYFADMQPLLSTHRQHIPAQSLHTQGMVLRFDPAVGKHGAFYFADVQTLPESPLISQPHTSAEHLSTSCQQHSNDRSADRAHTAAEHLSNSCQQHSSDRSVEKAHTSTQPSQECDQRDGLRVCEGLAHHNKKNKKGFNT